MPDQDSKPPAPPSKTGSAVAFLKGRLPNLFDTVVGGLILAGVLGGIAYFAQSSLWDQTASGTVCTVDQQMTPNVVTTLTVGDVCALSAYVTVRPYWANVENTGSGALTPELKVDFYDADRLRNTSTLWHKGAGIIKTRFNRGNVTFVLMLDAAPDEGAKTVLAVLNPAQ